MDIKTKMYDLGISLIETSKNYEKCLDQIDDNIEQIENVIDYCNHSCSFFYRNFAKYASNKLNGRIEKYVQKMKKNIDKAIKQKNNEKIIEIVKKQETFKDYNYLKKVIDFYEEQKKEAYGYKEATECYLSFFKSFKYLIENLLENNERILCYIDKLNNENSMEY